MSSFATLESTTDALGWALLHSVWQIALVALLVAAVARFTSERAASIRYTLNYGALLVVLGLFCYTFLTNYTPPSVPGEANIRYTASMAMNADCPDQVATLSASAGPTSAAWSDFGASVFAGFGKHTGIISMLWLIGLLLYAGTYSWAFRHTHRLARQGWEPIPEDWELRFKHLLSMSGIRRPVLLTYSRLVQSPLTIGTLKPVVLLPLGFLCQLPPAQIEAVLLHEIAHIRRYDYLANLFQITLKSLFFFHPGIHFICRRIDCERENACDDYAVGYTQDPKILVRALATLTLLTQQKNALAMQIANPKYPIANRLNRLLNSKKPKSSMNFPRLLLPLGLVLCLSLFVAAANGPAENIPTAENLLTDCSLEPVAPIPTLSPSFLPRTRQLTVRIPRSQTPNQVAVIAPLASGDTLPPVASQPEEEELSPLDAHIARLQAAEARLNAQTERLAQMERRLAAEAEKMAQKTARINADDCSSTAKRELTQQEWDLLEDQFGEAVVKRLADELDNQAALSKESLKTMTEIAVVLAESAEMDTQLALSKAKMAELEIAQKKRDPKVVHLSTEQLINLRDDLSEAIIEDGLISRSDKPIKIEIPSSGETRVNGKAIPRNLEARYQRILDKYGVARASKRMIKLDGGSIEVGDPVGRNGIRGSFLIQ